MKALENENIILCLYITEVSMLQLLDDPWAEDGIPVSVYSKWKRNAMEILKDQVKQVKIKRLYFGQEFCSRLIPSIKDILTILQAVHDRNLEFTLVTPYVNDEGLKSVEKLLELLNNQRPGTEVVCNDWGVLLRIKENYNQLVPVIGRLLDKMKRDPRFSPEDYKRFFSEQGFQLLKDSNVTTPSYQRLLQSYNVVRVEFDNVPQGNNVNLADAPFKGSVYAPYGFVTTGRICFIGSLHAVPGNQFRVDTPCRFECRQYEQFMRRNISIMPGAADSSSVQQIELARKGKTIFFTNPDVSWVLPGRGFDRIIIEPRLPI